MENVLTKFLTFSNCPQLKTHLIFAEEFHNFHIFRYFQQHYW